MEKKTAAQTGNKKLKTDLKKDQLKKAAHKKDFLVVGLGASAGGVRALQEFFATMPPDSGMAFVVILHLSPEHESSLAQIIQAKTAMPVTQVTETVKVEPNNVYVIPPDRQLEMVDGVIRPAEAERPLGYRVVIDVFFRTLAEAYERHAVCVVLSGTGSDGTLGLKRVKESNGFAIVQAPDDAEYDSMPRSAINTQLADWILPVHQMAEKLLGFKKSSERLHLTDPDSDARRMAEEIHADESLREILTLLRVRTGHDFSNYKTPTLIRRIARHLQIHELKDIPSYLELLRNNPGEIQSLLKNILINVTNFFRDKQAFEALEKEVIPNLFAGKTGKDTVRVWSCGCASGEEAYSLAMLLNEYTDTLPDPPKFQVFASDVDEEAITEAREHRYSESIETDVSPDRLKRYFIKEGAYYRIKKELREVVLFAAHNVLRDPPFSRLDLISCRNLLIYLNRETQERVLRIFHFALQPQGYLFLGSSESAESVSALYAPVDKKQRIYSSRIAPATQSALPMMPVSGRWEVRLPEIRSESMRDRVASLSDIHYKLLENYAPSSVLVNQDFDIVYLSGTVSKFLRFSSGEPSRNLLKAVNPDLLPDLRAALFTAQREHTSSEFPNVRVNINGQETIINLIVRSVDGKDETSDFLLVIFEERLSPASLKLSDQEIEKIIDKDEAMENIVRRLEEDLQRTKEHLRFTSEQHETSVEELKASNEELQAINEELRSASEELETSKEELQSINEELTTVNQELKDKIDESGRINSDLQNLMAATEIATIFLDRNLLIKGYTPPVREIFNITSIDVGRPLEHFTHHLRYENLAADAEKALRSLASIEHEITDDQNRSYLARFAPYRTLDDRIDGVVLNFIDITVRKNAEAALKLSEERLQKAINIETVGVIFLNNSFEIIDCNRTFLQMSGYTLEEIKAGRFSWEAFTPEGFMGVSRQAIGELNSAVITTPYEKEYYRKDGSRFWALFAGKRIGENEIVEFVTDITERKRAEQTVREFEDRYRLFVNAVSDILYNMSPDWSEMRSLEGKKFLAGIDNPSRSWLETYIPKSDRLLAQEKIFEAIRTKSTFELEHRVIRADGTVGWTFSRAIPFLDASGEIVEWFGAASDITERKEAEERLRRSEEKYRTLFDSIDEGFCRIEVLFDKRGKAIDYRFLETNPAFERQTGLENAAGRTILELAPGHDSFWFKTYGQIAKTGKPLRFEHEAAELEKFFDVYAFRTGKPSENRLAVIFNDISERKRVEHIISDSEEKFRAIFNQAVSGIAETDLTGKFIRVNDRYCAIVGYPCDELLTMHLQDITHPDDLSRNIEMFERLVEKGDAFDIEKRYIRRDGTPVWVHNSVSAIKDENGRPQTAVAVSVDITESKSADYALRASEERLRLATEAAEAYTWEFDVEGKTYKFSANAAKVLGVAKRNLPRTVEDTLTLVYPDDRPLIEKALKKAVQRGEGFTLDLRTITQRGKTVWLALQTAVLKNEMGKPARVIGIAQNISLRKQTEESLRVSEERMRIAIEAGELATWEWDIPAERVIWNERHFKLFGMKPSRKPVRPEDFFYHVHPDDRDWVGERLNKAIEKKITFEAEFRALVEGGGVRWMNGYGRVTETDRRGKAVKMSGVMFDITTRKKVEQALSESETRFRAIVGQTAAGIAEMDLNGNYTLVNQKFCVMLGYPENELLKLNVRDVTHPEDLPHCLEIIEKTIETGISMVDKKRLLRKNGEIVWISDSISRVDDVQGEPRRVAAIAVNITQRKIAEDELRKSEEQLQLILESTKDYAIITFDVRGFITRWNSGAQKIFGYTEKEAVGRYAAFLFTPEDQAQGVPEQELKNAIKKGRAEDERWHLRKNGSRFFASGVMRPLKDGKLEGFVKIARDQTERLEVENALREKETLQKLVTAQEDERKRIARDLHDELGQQLTALRIKLDELTKKQKEPVLLNRLHEIQNIARSIDDGVDFLAWELRPSVLDDLGLVPALENYIKQWSHYAKVKAELTVSNLKRARFAPEVETCLYRIVQEALNNTHKHAEATNAGVVLEKHGETLILIIEDNGRGFRPKNKVNRSKGIGLVGMKERAELAGGTFEIESAPHKGTTIYVRIPFSTAKEK